jgi:hypothetical protein
MQHFAIQRVNGRPVKVPVEPDGSVDVDVLCRLASIAPDRALVLQRPDGSNLVVNRGQKMKVQPRSCFVDAPTHTRGRW